MVTLYRGIVMACRSRIRFAPAKPADRAAGVRAVCPIEHLHAHRRRCAECQRLKRNERQREWGRANPDRVRAIDVKRRDHTRERDRARYVADP